MGFYEISVIDFKMVKDGYDKWPANKIIFGQRYDLANAVTFKYLVENRYLEIVEFLVQLGTDIDSALIFVANYGYFEIIKCLIQNGADISADDNYTPLLVIRNNHLDIVEYLIQNVRLNMVI